MADIKISGHTLVTLVSSMSVPVYNPSSATVNARIATGDFATAAQGATADTALQPGEVDTDDIAQDAILPFLMSWGSETAAPPTANVSVVTDLSGSSMVVVVDDSDTSILRINDPDGDPIGGAARPVMVHNVTGHDIKIEAEDESTIIAAVPNNYVALINHTGTTSVWTVHYSFPAEGGVASSDNFAVVVEGSSADHTATPFQFGSGGAARGEQLVVTTTVVGTHVYEFTDANLTASAWGGIKKNTTTASVIVAVKGDNTGGSEVTLRYGTTTVATDTNLILYGDGAWFYDNTSRIVHLIGQWAGGVNFHGEDITEAGAIFQDEQAAAGTDVAGQGQWWTQDGTPSRAMVTSDDGADMELDGGRVLTSVSGALTRKLHHNQTIVISGNVTVPNASTDIGFQCNIIAGGAYTVTFNSLTSAAMASGDVLTVLVQSTSVINAVLVAETDLVDFS